MTRPSEVTHTPDRPFGCVVMWGPPVLRDMPIHVCNLYQSHKRHTCKCGARSS